MRKNSIKRLVYAGFLLALGMILPYFTGQIPSLGNRLLPMHIPVLIAGFVCGWPYGLAVGLILPVFRSGLLGMPPMFPTAIAMSFELATYGFITGILHRYLSKKNVFVYVNLIIAMICGRLIWGAVSYFLYGFSESAFTWKAFVTMGFVNAIPGIIIQIIIIPIIVIALKKGNYIEN